MALRLGTIYGPRINLDSTNGLLVALLAALDRGERPQVPWTRDTVHGLVYVADAALAVVRALDVEHDIRGAVNVVGPPVTAEQLYSTLVAQYGGDPADIAWRDERARYQLVSTERLATLLGVRDTDQLARRAGRGDRLVPQRAAHRAAPGRQRVRPMTRILYLSLSNEKYSTNYFPFLRRYAGEVAAPGTELELRGARVGRVDSYRFWETLDTVSILDSVVGAEPQGFDAVAIGNILDPGLRDARSMVDIPVLGLGETCMLAACMMGSRFSLVGVNPYFGGRFEENVARYGLKERLAGLAFMALTPARAGRLLLRRVGARAGTGGLPSRRPAKPSTQGRRSSSRRAAASRRS